MTCHRFRAHTTAFASALVACTAAHVLRTCSPLPPSLWGMFKCAQPSTLAYYWLEGQEIIPFCICTLPIHIEWLSATRTHIHRNRCPAVEVLKRNWHISPLAHNGVTLYPAFVHLPVLEPLVLTIFCYYCLAVRQSTGKKHSVLANLYIEGVSMNNDWLNIVHWIISVNL